MVETAEDGILRLTGKLRGEDLVAFVRADALGNLRPPEMQLSESCIRAFSKAAMVRRTRQRHGRAD